MISLSEILHTIAQALMIPCLIILLVLMAGAVWQIGDIVVEYIAERRKHKCNVPQLLRDVHAAGADGPALRRHEARSADDGRLARRAGGQ